MRPAQTVEASVRSQLRAPMDVQGAATAPAEPWLPSPADGFSFPAQMAEVGGASGSSQAAGAAGAAASAVAGASSAAGGKRRSQHCRTCGHKMRVGAFKRHHNQFLSSPGPLARCQRVDAASRSTRWQRGPSGCSVASVTAAGMILIRGGAARRRWTRSLLQGKGLRSVARASTSRAWLSRAARYR